MRNSISPLLIYLSVLLFSDFCKSEDLDGFFARRRALDPAILAQIDTFNKNRLALSKQLKSKSADPGAEGVVRKFNAWPTNRVSVCFFDGNDSTFSMVAELAKYWTDEAGISFDFGTGTALRRCSLESPSDIRVSFEGLAFYSEVGVLAKLIPASRPTMVLGGIGDSQTMTEAKKGKILHEFGHALGLEHEHQNPEGGCLQEFKKNYLYQKYGDKTWVDKNILEMFGSGSADGLYATSFDTESIMIYSLPPQAFIDPTSAKCYVSSLRSTLSAIDRKTVKVIYPP